MSAGRRAATEAARSPIQEARAIEEFPSRFGKYLLLELISTGGMAEVFRVKAFGVEGFQKTFALKRILPHISEDPEFITMFIDEAKIASRLHHGNICQIYEFGRVGDFYFQLMEYIAGFDLRALKEHLLAQQLTLPLGFLLHVLARACEGLDYAHRKTDSQGNPLNIIHRDVSPQNIMVSFEGTVKIIDFGIAKAKSRASQTQAGVIKGKFAYMAPELLRGEQIDGRADIFALGIVLHELLTGQGLFDRETDLDTLRAVMAADVPPPSSIDPTIPPEVDEVVLKALTSQPADRYQSTEDFQEALERCIMRIGEPYSSNKVRHFMAELFPIDLAVEREKAQRFASFSETGEVEIQAEDGVPTAGPRAPKTVETFSGRRLKDKRSRVTGAGPLTEEVTLIHGTADTGEREYDEDEILDGDDLLLELPDSPLEWQQAEGYEAAFLEDGEIADDDLPEVEGVLLEDDDSDFAEVPTNVAAEMMSAAWAASHGDPDGDPFEGELLGDDIDDIFAGRLMAEGDLLENAPPGPTLVEGELTGDDLMEAELLDDDFVEAELLDDADLIEAELTGDEPPPALGSGGAPAQQGFDDEPEYATVPYTSSDPNALEGGYAEGGYAEGEYAEGEYAEGEYAEGEYAEGEYAEGEYAEGEYAEGEYAVGEYAEG
ncbi:MAG: protein kinase, partial [bacterium]